MKIIELLNKIANGEHNFKFKYCDLEYFWDFSSKAFIDTESKMTIGERWEIDNILNDEIEEIEEDKKIEELENYISCGWNGTCKDLKRIDLFEDLEKIGNKINEIIDKMNAEYMVNKEMALKIHEIIDKTNKE